MSEIEPEQLREGPRSQSSLRDLNTVQGSAAIDSRSSLRKRKKAMQYLAGEVALRAQQMRTQSAPTSRSNHRTLNHFAPTAPLEKFDRLLTSRSAPNELNEKFARSTFGLDRHPQCCTGF